MISPNIWSAGPQPSTPLPGSACALKSEHLVFENEMLTENLEHSKRVRLHHTEQVSEEVNRKCPAKNTTVQL